MLSRTYDGAQVDFEDHYDWSGADEIGMGQVAPDAASTSDQAATPTRPAGRPIRQHGGTGHESMFPMWLKLLLAAAAGGAVVGLVVWNTMSPGGYSLKRNEPGDE